MLLIAIVGAAVISSAPAAHAPVFSVPSVSRPASAPRPAPPPPVRLANRVAHNDYPSPPLTYCFIQKREPGEDTVGISGAPLSPYGPCPQTIFTPPF